MIEKPAKYPVSCSDGCVVFPVQPIDLPELGLYAGTPENSV